MRAIRDTPTVLARLNRIGADTEESDLDLLVEPSDSTTLLTIAGLRIDAETLLGMAVDVLTPNSLPPKFRDKVLRRAQPL